MATAWRSDGLPSVAPVRRRGRGLTMVLLLLVLVCAVGIGERLLPEQFAMAVKAAAGALPALQTPTSPLVPGQQPLPPLDARDYPAPGFEETDAPLAVAPSAPVTGAPFAFSRIQTTATGEQVPVAWSPCRPIHYVIDTTGAPPGFGYEVELALVELSMATGLIFVQDAPVTEPPEIQRPSFLPRLYGDRWAPVRIGFADERTVPILEGSIAGVASPVSVVDRTTGVQHLVSGVVYIDTDVLGQQIHTGDPAYLGVLRHELGHLVGLGHVHQPNQLMHPSTSGIKDFQAGDRAGLAALGRGACAPGL